MFQVEWIQSALDDLARFWTRAGSEERQRITSANNLVERRLRTSAAGEGESRPKGRRITFEPPLAVIFRLEADGRTVSVLEVRYYRSRKS